MIIGIDGATWDLIDPWMERGLLPTFKRLVEKGVRGPLRSTVPPHSAPAWTSAFTGVNPGKHNVFCFSDRRGYDLKLSLSSDRKARPIWKVLSDRGLKVVVINVPNTYPPDKVNGVMVSGMAGAPPVLPNYTYPKELKVKLDHGGYVIDYVCAYAKDRRKGLQRTFDMIEKRRQLALELAGDLRWDLFIAVFTTLDRVQHTFWQYTDTDSGCGSGHDSSVDSAVKETYARLDSVLAEMLAIAGEDTNVIVLSDHGFGSVSRIFYLNNWLRDRGILNLEQTDGKRLQYGTNLTLPFRRVLEKMLKKLSPSMRDNIAAGHRLKRMVSAGVPRHVDWKKTKAWALPEGFVQLNLQGREPMGTVEPGEQYETLRRDIAEGLFRLKDPETGETFVKGVYPREELYFGPYGENAADLLVQVRDGYTCDLSYGDHLFGKPLDITSGAHREFGIFLASGPDIKERHNINDLGIVDIAPTILHTLGLPLPVEMDGKVLTGIFRAESDLSSRPVVYEEPAEEKQRLLSKISRIKALT